MARSKLNVLSAGLYKAARMTRDARAVERSIETGSPAPIARRVVRIAAGRTFGKFMRRTGI
jgi:hypothetical protein